MPKGMWLPADWNTPVESRDFDRLEDYQSGVGGMIEAVDLRRIDTTMFVNEEGHMRGLEFNPRATMLWWYWEPAARHNAMIVGDAVLVGWPDQEGNSTDLRPDLLGVFTEAESFRIDVQWRPGNEWEPVLTPLEYRDYFDTLVWALIFVEHLRPHQLKVVTTVVPGEQPVTSEPAVE